MKTEWVLQSRRILFALAVLLAVTEFVDAFFINVPFVGIAYSISVAAAAVWLLQSSSRWPAILLGLLGALELFAVIAIYPHSPHPPATWRLALFALVTAAVVVGAAVTAWPWRSAATPERLST